MIKSLLLYILAFTLLFVTVHLTQKGILGQNISSIRFSLWNTNLFFAISSLLICIHFLLFSSIKKLRPQLGFIYLPTLFIKGILFFALFKSSIFKLESLSILERVNLLVPLLLFLILEVYFIVRILGEKKP
ncbi:DUF6168 family protein [Psychroserpens sp. Hel_I_66]|uniref:DUF6168 family protein n=1 Tax=Psychroserpens sp. Hel_I_66 TaxID=1250004 RepID=UPI0006484F7B